MTQSMLTSLVLPNDAAVLELARGYLNELARLADFGEADAQALVEAGIEACVNIIRHAYAPGEAGTFTITGELSPVALDLSFLDHGMPLDRSVEEGVASTEASSAAVRGAGHGLERIRHAVDEAHWINHGRGGKELRLVKNRPHADVTAHLPEEQLGRFREDEAAAPPQEYTVRRFQAADAVGVARCVYRVYGYTYEQDDLYYPDRIAHLNETGELISVVALDATGEVVGHYALERPEGPGGMSRVAERGEAVVAPAHRGRHLLQRMRALLEEEGRRAGLAGTFGEAVTVHTYSQKVNDEFGAKACGIILGEWPGSITFKAKEAEAEPQRQSYVVYFEYLAPPALAEAHAPSHHREMLEMIYGQLESPVEFREPRAPAGSGQLAVEFQRAEGYGLIRVRQAGADTAAEIRRARRDLIDVSGAEAVYLEVPLAQAGTPDLCSAAEADGFFFSGIGPLFAPDGDVLRLQFLNVPLDSSTLQLSNPFAQELLAYVEKERIRVSHGYGG
jgi:anti-sigma regulatory factor (Ser/Thr protein kinase)